MPKCDPYTIEEPKIKDGNIITRKMVEHRSGWGKPIIRTIGTVPVYKTHYHVSCNLNGGLPKLEVPKLEVLKLGPYRSIKEIDRQIVGYVTETELAFEKPFRPLDISYAASLLGSALFLLKLFCRPASENSEGPPCQAS